VQERLFIGPNQVIPALPPRLHAGFDQCDDRRNALDVWVSQSLKDNLGNAKIAGVSLPYIEKGSGIHRYDLVRRQVLL